MVTKKKAAKRVGQKRKANKSQAVRDYLATSPTAGPTEVVAALKKKGVKVSPQQVSTIKSTSNKGKKKPGRKMASTNGQVNVRDLVAAKGFADRVGGVDNAQELLAALGKLG